VNLKDRVAIVTGGGTGIGRATSERLAAAGAGAVVVNYSRSERDAEDTAEALRTRGTAARTVRADVGDEAAVRAMIDATVAEHGRLDVLVNCAGVTRFIPHPDLDALTDDVWRAILSTNLMGPFYASRAAGPALRRARGAIVNVSSISGLRASGSSLPYAVSKAALLQLTRSLAVALAPEVMVNAVAPGHVVTRWHRDHLGDEKAAEQARAIAETEPLGRTASADDVAAAIVSLLTSEMVTGQTIVVDGGKHLLY
jgi:NAD(P)-dependent dehydrogenase (short-subunit alcohol dehydrogenase family)